MTPTATELYLRDVVLPAAFRLLPRAMDSLEARAMLLAIALQESDCLHRRQIVDPGVTPPARGFWQFEQGGGVIGVLTHPATWPVLKPILEQLRYGKAPKELWLAIEHNDVLAAVFARLNLWWLSGRLPRVDEHVLGWVQYRSAWRPGRPHPADWPANFARAWALVGAQRELEARAA